MYSVMVEALESRRMLSAAAPLVASSESSQRVGPAIHASVHAAKPPTAKLHGRPITTALSSYSFTVAYHSTVGISASTIATGNLSLSGPAGYVTTPTLVSLSPASNAKTIVAVYSVTPPSGATFMPSDNGIYTATLLAGSVSDINNLSTASPVRIGTYKVQIKAVPAPTGKLVAQTMSSAAPSYSFQVIYHGSIPINASTIATGNLIVTGPAGYQQTAALTSISPSHNSATIKATYSITGAGGGAFGAGDNGTYTVSLVAGSVMNTRGASAAAANLGTFAVNIQGSSPPAATIPNMVGTYTGTNIVPSAGSYHYVSLNVATEDAAGHISGSWVTDVGVVFNFTGTVATDGTFSYNFSTPANTNHATGPVTGNGTGSGAGTNALSFSFTATSAGFTAPGTMSVTKG